MAKANSSAIRSILHHRILNPLRNGARSGDYVRVMSGASKGEINSLVKRGVLVRVLEENRRSLQLSRLGEAYLRVANITLAEAGAAR